MCVHRLFLCSLQNLSHNLLHFSLFKTSYIWKPSPLEDRVWGLYPSAQSPEPHGALHIVGHQEMLVKSDDGLLHSWSAPHSHMHTHTRTICLPCFIFLHVTHHSLTYYRNMFVMLRYAVCFHWPPLLECAFQGAGTLSYLPLFKTVPSTDWCSVGACQMCESPQPPPLFLQ